MTATEETTSPPPRMFFRRGLAFVVDSFILSAAFQLALIVLVNLLPSAQYYFPGGMLESTTCRVVENNSVFSEIDRRMTPAPGEVRTDKICQISSPGKPVLHLGIAEGVTRSGNHTTIRNISFYIGPDQQIIFPNSALNTFRSLAEILLLSLGMALLLFWLGSPGKRLMGMQIRNRTTGESTPELTLKTSAKREFLKFFPLTIIAALGVVVAVMETSTNIVEDMPAQLSELQNDPGIYWLPIALLGIATLVWFFGPFIVWRGATFYDRILSLEVVRSA